MAREQKTGLVAEMGSVASPDFRKIRHQGAGPLKLEMSAFVRWLAGVSETAGTYEASVDIDVEWKASDEDLAQSDKEVLSPDWKPTLTPASERVPPGTSEPRSWSGPR